MCGSPFSREPPDSSLREPYAQRLLNWAIVADCWLTCEGTLAVFVGSLRLMTYLTPGKVPVGYSLTRLGAQRGLRPEKLPCLDRLPETALAKLRMFSAIQNCEQGSIDPTPDGRLRCAAVSSRTYRDACQRAHRQPRAEMVAAFAAENKLATIVGTPDGGAGAGRRQFPHRAGFPAAPTCRRLVQRGRERSWRGAASVPIFLFRCRSKRYAPAPTISFNVRSRSCRQCERLTIQAADQCAAAAVFISTG